MHDDTRAEILNVHLEQQQIRGFGCELMRLDSIQFHFCKTLSAVASVIIMLTTFEEIWESIYIHGPGIFQTNWSERSQVVNH